VAAAVIVEYLLISLVLVFTTLTETPLFKVANSDNLALVASDNFIPIFFKEIFTLLSSDNLRPNAALDIV
jgi:hypothetical protein